MPISHVWIMSRFLHGQYVSSHGDVISHVNISNVRVTDGGLYECRAHNTAGDVRHSARLNVYGAPTIRQMGQLTAVAGETFSVTCPVGGHPIHKITWHRGKRGDIQCDVPSGRTPNTRDQGAQR